MTPDDSDEVIEPDSVSGPADEGFGLDELAERAVEVVLGLLRRANKFAGGVLLFAVASCVIGYLLGIAALGGGLRTFWIIAGGALALWAIGSLLVAMFRLRAVRTGSDLMVEEVRSLIGGDVRSERTVIETVESTQGADDGGVVQMSRQFFSLRDVVEQHRSDFTQLSLALSSITSLPAAIALAVAVAIAFSGLSLIFALILIF